MNKVYLVELREDHYTIEGVCDPYPTYSHEECTVMVVRSTLEKAIQYCIDNVNELEVPESAKPDEAYFVVSEEIIDGSEFDCLVVYKHGVNGPISL